MFAHLLMPARLSEHRSLEFPAWLKRIHLRRLLESLQQPLAHGDERRLGLRTGEQLHQGRGPGFAGAGNRAEPRCFHHRSPEPVALVKQRLTHRHTNPDDDWPPARPDEQRTLLHGHRTVHTIDDAVEHCHDPVAGVLDLRTIVIRQRRAKHREVLTPNVIPSPFTEPVEELGRANDVTEQHRRRRAPPHRAQP